MESRSSRILSAQGAPELIIAVFFDLENLVRHKDSKKNAFQPRLVLDRLLEKGKVLVKRAYGDWSKMARFKSPLHELGVELIEIPQRDLSGKNSADIRMVVDAMDVCFAKEHVDTFALVSGDSDFSPLVSKLRENNKTVIGIGTKGSTSRILVENCDEFIFYEDIARGDQPTKALSRVDSLPADKREAFLLMLSSIQALQRENKEVLWSSLVKQTMKRKEPAFDESSYGYSSFSRLLQDAKRHGLIELQKDEKSGSLVVQEASEGGR